MSQEKLINFLRRLGFQKKSNLFYIFKDKEFPSEEYNITAFLNPFDQDAFEVLLRTPFKTYENSLFYDKEIDYDEKIKNYFKILKDDLSNFIKAEDDYSEAKNELAAIVLDYGFTVHEDGYYELKASNGQHLTIIQKLDRGISFNFLKYNNEKEYKNFNNPFYDFDGKRFRKLVHSIVNKMPYLDGWVDYTSAYVEDLRLSYLTTEPILHDKNAEEITKAIVNKLDPFYWSYFFKISSELINNEKEVNFELEVSWSGTHKEKRKNKFVSVVTEKLQQEIDDGFVTIDNSLDSFTILKIDTSKYTPDKSNKFILNLKKVMDEVTA